MTWLSALLLLIASIVRPTSARCAPHWYLGEGVRRSGAFSCVFLAAEPDETTNGPSVSGRVYCTNGQEAITTNGRTVSCQQRH